jgi:uncharacterized protein GlcG (DUF336 family)
MPSAAISYQEAARVLAAAQRKAAELGCHETVSIAVTDAGGALVSMLRADDRWFEGEVAMARAFSAAALRRDGQLTGSKLDTSAHWRTMSDHMAGRISLGPGGVLLRADGRDTYDHGLDEEILGAIGVSGGPSAEIDEQIARAGALAARRDGPAG